MFNIYIYVSSAFISIMRTSYRIDTTKIVVSLGRKEIAIHYIRRKRFLLGVEGGRKLRTTTWVVFIKPGNEFILQPNDSRERV